MKKIVILIFSFSLLLSCCGKDENMESNGSAKTVGLRYAELKVELLCEFFKEQAIYKSEDLLLIRWKQSRGGKKINEYGEVCRGEFMLLREPDPPSPENEMLSIMRLRVSATLRPQ